MSDSNPHDVTQDLRSKSHPREKTSHIELPQKIGRYRVEKILGKGGFGLVYLARDEQLDRRVAIKVPHARLLKRPQDVEAYLIEAQTVAGLDHPHIVPVYDVGSSNEFPCYIVSKFIKGTNLATRLRQSRLDFASAAGLVATVAEALHHAHMRGLVDRDVKPSNILLDEQGQPHVVDFGLALRETDLGKGARYAGTPAYMSPEQARGEGHRVDGRSDIYSLGAVLYELLTGRRSVSAETRHELLDEIITQEIKPPRQIEDLIPKELERICLKALAKRASDRYTTALDMAEDLRHYLASQSPLPSDNSPAASSQSVPSDSSSTIGDSGTVRDDSSKEVSESQIIKIVPKGLRSFDAHDADFFLELLPGPRDRDGLPDSLRFWKTRIEETDADNTFSVGLIYGPSGCGKSSLVKAGLLPRLSQDVIPVYVESTPEETETRLLHRLRKHFPALKAIASLKETLASIRRGEGIAVGKKVVIVLDQFEQWLHTKKTEENAELLQALRQCDGERVQCVVMVRDDFWMAATRFMRNLEIRLVEAHNSAAVDLFPIRHAEKVLAAFGRAFGTLPENAGDISQEQRAFLKLAVEGLAEEGRVICVRLALFAEMMKGKPWTPATLSDVGGTSGVGFTFLEETFAASTAPPEHRYHQKAARAVLKTLLPESGTNIKGYMRSHAELLEASGYATRPQEFDDLIRILDSEIRLITPTDPEGLDEDAETKLDTAGRYYQLTHDYLVHSLRSWLTRKQRETRRGRAELRLAERSAMWASKPQNRHLPSLWEFANIQLLTNKRNWSETQRKMMSKAGSVLGARWGTAVVVLLLAGIAIQQTIAAIRHENLIGRVETTVATMRISRGLQVPWAINDLRELPDDLVIEELKARFEESQPLERLSLAYALSNYGEEYIDFLLSAIANAPSSECPNLVAALGQNKDIATSQLAALAKEADGNQDWRLKGRLAILGLHLEDASLAVDIFATRPDPSQQTFFIHELFPSWHAELRQLAEVVDATHNAPLRAGICLALGNLPDEQLVDSKSALKKLLTEWFHQSSDSATHSATHWALRKWGVESPDLGKEFSEPQGSDWKITPMGREHNFTLVRIPKGQFTRSNGEIEQTVTLTQDLWLSDSEVTVGLFHRFINDQEYHSENPAPKDWMSVATGVSPTNRHPVQQASWLDAVLFCNWLSVKEERLACYSVARDESSASESPRSLTVNLLEDGDGYRLPTEAEWEYACRAGTTTPFSFGSDADWLKYYGVCAATKTEVVGSKMCNGWGLFDMHGNVAEWCHDWFGDYSGAEAEDPQGADGGEDRVYRGGSWLRFPRFCRSLSRHGNVPRTRSKTVGFRVALVAHPD